MASRQRTRNGGKTSSKPRARRARRSRRSSAKTGEPTVEVKLTPWELFIRGSGYVAVISILVGILAAIACAGPR